MRLAVKDPLEDKVVLVESADILYITIERNKVVYHTEDRFYFNIDSLEEIGIGTRLLYGFERVDRNYIVNMSKVTVFDGTRNILFFENEVKKNSKFALVSGPNIGKVKEYMLSRELEVIEKAPNFMQFLLNHRFVEVPVRLEEELQKIKRALQMMEITFHIQCTGSRYQINLLE